MVRHPVLARIVAVRFRLPHASKATLQMELKLEAETGKQLDMDDFDAAEE